jgi:bidirectional [NiFe] hydrogenase diaphorase subunit
MMIHLTINDKPIEVAEGRTLLEACHENGIHVPTLCYHPALEPFGACRLCMVEVSQPPRPPRLVASCVYPCEEGVVVKTDTEAVCRSRRIAAELLLAGAHNTPEVVALAKELGVKQVRFKMPEAQACVLCGLCVRACREIVGVSAISMAYRGIAKKVSTPFQVASSRCIGCGTCVLVCPTGAIQLSDVGGFRGVHPSGSEYDRVYSEVCTDADLSPHFVQDVSALLAAQASYTFDQE